VKPDSFQPHPALTANGAAVSADGHRNPLLAIAPQLLAVELLLLAFFILLNAVSSFEPERSRSVIDSVRDAFRTPGIQGEAVGSTQTEAATLATVQQHIGRLAHALGATQGSDRSQPDALWIDLPVDAFFRAGEDRLKPGQGTFLDRLAELLAKTPAGYAYEVAVLRGGADAAAMDADLRLRQAGAAAAALRTRIDPRAVIAAGMAPDAAVGIRISVAWSAAPEAEVR
jgi:hypothetical protein